MNKLEIYNKYSEYPYGVYVTTSNETVGYKICVKYKCNDYPVYNCNLNSKMIIYKSRGKWRRGLVYHVENGKKRDRQNDKWEPNVFEDKTVRIKEVKGKYSILYDAERKENECCVCLSSECRVGVLHSGSVHNCLCGECALSLMNNMTLVCPLCREPIESYVEVY